MKVSSRFMAMLCLLCVVGVVGRAAEQTADELHPPLVSEDPQAPSPYWLDDVRNCGPRCLQFLERWFGGQRSFREISTLCPPLQNGVPLEGLADAARQLGWGVAPFTSSARQLARVQPPAILHLKRPPHADPHDQWQQNHFVVLLAHDPGRNEFLVFDPPGSARTVSARYLGQRYSGLGLLVWRDAMSPVVPALARRRLWWPACFAAGFVAAAVALARFRPTQATRAPSSRFPDAIAAGVPMVPANVTPGERR
jgi:hypothetical protein